MTTWNRRRAASGYDGVALRNTQGRPSVILYEYPFNERIRTYLRLEHLFRRLGELVPRSHPIDHHYALATIFEVMDVGARADLKSDVMKDLDKQKQALNGYRGNPAIAESVLDEVVGKLDRCFTALNNLPGKAGQSLTENDWLMSIRSRVGIPGGTCEFDLPGYYAWQHRDAGAAPGRPGTLGRRRWRRWPNRSTCCSSCCATRARRRRSWPATGSCSRTCRRAAPSSCCACASTPRSGLVPEISGNRLMVSVRLMRQEAPDRLQASNDNAQFELTLCS